MSRKRTNFCLVLLFYKSCGGNIEKNPYERFSLLFCFTNASKPAKQYSFMINIVSSSKLDKVFWTLVDF